MAKNKFGRAKHTTRMTGYLKGNVDERLTFGGLAARTLIATAFDEVVIEKTLISSIKATYTMDKFTPVIDAGPIWVGIAHSDYTASEIEEVIENSGSWNQGDLVQSKEVAKRLVRKIGVFDTPADATQAYTLNDGIPIKTKLNWVLTTGKTLQIWVYNAGQAAVATTVPNVVALGHANLFPA